MLTYGEFEDAVLFAIVEAEVYGAPAANSAGQIDVFEAVEQAGEPQSTLLDADSEGLRTGFRRKPDSVPMTADSR